MKVPPARIVISDDDRATILELIDASLRSGSLTLGPHGAAFEAAFAERHQVEQAVAVSSGTSAIEIIVRSLGLAGREVLVPANTFFATAAAVLHAGARVRFADVDAATFALSPATIEAALSPDTAAVVLVHIGGLVTPDIDAIADLCRRRGILLIEDAAHAHGSSWQGRSAGTFGVAAAFSFYPTKVLTSGEGGMITTNDEAVANEARLYRDQGKAGFLGGEHVRLGYAWRLSEVHAAIGVVQLGRLDEHIAHRRTIAARYDAALSDVPGLEPVLEPVGCVSNYYKYVALLEPGVDRAELKQRVRDEHGVGLSGEVYARPLHHEPIFAGIADVPLPVAEDICSRHICLPLHSDMTDEEAELVTTATSSVVGASRPSTAGAPR